MNQQTVEPVEFDPFAQSPIERVFASSEAQREVWLADKLSREASLAFNEAVTLRLHGALDAAVLRGALLRLVARHDALRSTFSADGTQMLVGSELLLNLVVEDLSALPATEQAQRVQQTCDEAVEQPFNLEQGPLFKAVLHRLTGSEHVLMLVAHHIICDGWSWGVMVQELGELYAEQLGLAPEPEAAPSYGDYVAWEVREAASGAMAEHERFWLGRFSGGSLPVLDLPTDRPRAKLRSFRSQRVDHLLAAELVTRVRQLGARNGASAFGTLFAGFAALLARLTGQDDIVVGVPAAGQSASGMQHLVGHCVNLLPVRVAVDAQQPVSSYIKQASSGLLDAFEHQTLTYGSLLKKLPVQRDPSRLPLVSVMFNVDQAVSSTLDSFPDLRADMQAVARHYENFELFVNAAQIDGGLRLECQYNADLFDHTTVQNWLQAYEALLDSATRSADTALAGLDWLTPAQRQAIQALQPKLVPVAEPALMHVGFVRQARATPDAIAVVDGSQTLSYRALDEQSNRLARELRQRGVQRGAKVGICLPRGADMLAALLAVLKAGASYVPLDPGFPQARLAYYAEDAQLSLLLTQSDVAVAPTDWCADAAQRCLRLDADRGWLSQPADELQAGTGDALPQDAAYVIYTSGSTGKPKGVCVSHRNVANFLASMSERPGLAATDRLAAVTTLSFDIAVLELLLPLSVGARTIIVPRETAMDGNLLQRLLNDSGATCMQATPGMWRLLVDAGWQGNPQFKALAGGEALPQDLALALLDRTGELWNMYGPTETTVWSTIWKVDADVLARSGVSIGTPIANTSVWILDEQLKPCPIGVPGEICIGGEGVTLGYLGRPEMTADRFVADPFVAQTGARLYRTGDRGRWRHDGLLEHLGRLDFQVKLRGYRIELGEIESHLMLAPGVSDAVVVAREDQPGDVSLVAYVAARGARIDLKDLNKSLCDRLPDYMLPQHVVVLDALPLLPNGKVDRKSLPAPQRLAGQPAERPVEAPRNDLERAVLLAMEAVLNLPGLSIHDDFFALGGHSLLAARLTARLNRDLEINLPLRTLFQCPTPATLAQAIHELRGLGIAKHTPIVARPGRTRAPLTVMQERIRFVEEMQPGRVAYNTPSVHRLTGELNRAAFEAALRDVVARQSTLRTYVARDDEGGYVQAIAPELRFDLPLEDLSSLPAAEREAELLRRMQAIIDAPMDIYAAPLFRVALYKLAEQEHAFLFMPHHLIWDGWSFDLLYTEMAEAYVARLNGSTPGLPPLPFTYGDYAQWHQDWMSGAEFQQQLKFWVDRYSRAKAVRALRTDKPRHAGMSGVGGAEWVHVDAALTDQLRDVARSLDCTLNMLTLSVYAALMGHLVQHDSVVIGLPVRGRLRAELESIMGFFNNLLPLQLEVGREQSFAAFVRSVKQNLLDAMSHQDVPFERLAIEPVVARHTQRVGLYQALFSFQDARERQRVWGGLMQQTILVMQKGATEDLGLWLMEVPSGLEGSVIYNADIYEAQTAQAFRTRYLELLSKLVARPDLSVAELVDDGGSAAAQRLHSLSPLDQPAAAPVSAPAAAPVSQPVRQALSGTQLQIAQVWAELLGLGAEQVGLSDNFFDIGGNSLLAMQAVERMVQATGKRLQPTRYVFETLEQLAKAYDAESAQTDASEPGARKSGGLLGKLGGWLKRG